MSWRNQWQINFQMCFFLPTIVESYRRISHKDIFISNVNLRVGYICLYRKTLILLRSVLIRHRKDVCNILYSELTYNENCLINVTFVLFNNFLFLMYN